mmetsp:Transcript_41151/g.109839  ORF Transcript_41151/g.109839 Transcript_41151/m.109839 type:complete len:209 (+) Transcript_41151:135-761(+)
MISVIVVILVGIGFTRLTMLALEMQDEDDLFDSAPAETLLRKEIIVERMRAMKKPRALVITGEDQCKLPEADLIARQEERERENDIFASMYSATPRVKEDEPDEEKGSDLEELASAIENKLAPELAETEIDANDLCIICFERSKNAVGNTTAMLSTPQISLAFHPPHRTPPDRCTWTVGTALHATAAQSTHASSRGAALCAGHTCSKL